ncbi:sugar-binding protein [Paraflavitalea pollutisoli]|uniref:sugar-binding protein n=1 Tax=Paraflavitalea pollutisoli TaxID=3034143 RepID=UPI0023ECC162|nr:sugar-binding protein [Paraflavitalea sp. H1-2-19X]
MIKTTLLALVSIASTFFATAQNVKGDTAIVRKQYYTQRLTGTITLDGVPDEAAWNAVPWGGEFTQWQPHEGNAPSQPTSFKILYDEKFLYVAYRCHDSAPDSIVRRMDRRDRFPGDWVEINIDSYHDLRT